MRTLTLFELQDMIYTGRVQGPFSVLIYLKPNRTWAATFLHVACFPVEQSPRRGSSSMNLVGKRSISVIKPLDCHAHTHHASQPDQANQGEPTNALSTDK